MNKRFLLKVTLGLLLLISLVSAQDENSLLKLEDLLSEAVNNNPQLKAFYHAARADSARIPQSGSLPDPMISLNVLNLPVDNFVFNQEPMTGKQVAFKQVFPFPGKLSIKEEIARKGAEVSLSNYNELKNQLVRNVKNSYYDLYYTDASIATVQKNKSLLEEFVSIASQKYAVGKGLQQDVLKAQVELSKMIDRLISLRQKRERIEARLNALLNRPVQTPLGKTPELRAVPFNVSRDSLETMVDKNRPMLKAWQTRIEQSDEQIALANKMYWPDFSLFVAYTQREVLQNGNGGVDFLSGGVTFNVPLYFWRKQDKQVQETRLNKIRVEESYFDVRNQIYAALDNIITELDKNRQLLDLYKTGIIPQSAQSLESALIGYQTDKVDFLTLINNQMTLLNMELEYARILSAYNKNLAELEYIVGTKLE
ncbi:MAG TPA: TolC family protein [Caldithrix abyssi]|uniref:TolC family protein n=1 Tax=Caldithrix abyssi TaxID=187145 RepID=A0A7V4U0E0_CALAY|nr:TolC family protein [Caldithrix abyssi]